MTAKDIKIGTKLEIEIPEYNKKELDTTTTYISQLIDVYDTETICIAAPLYETKYKFLSNGLKITIFYLNERQELLCFNAIVLENKKLDNLETFIIKIQGEFSKIQRRRYFRLHSLLNAQYSILKNPQLDTNKYQFEKLDNTTIKSAMTKNISGSGCCIVIDEDLSSGSVLDIELYLNDVVAIRVLGKVIRVEKNSANKYETGMHYIKISSKDTELLMKFIFEQQRIILKNSMMRKA